MEIEGLRPSMPASARSVQPQGVSAQLAEARAKLREATPPDRWNAVMDEVTKVQVDRSASMLEAMQIVLRRMAAGWLPPSRD
jgi:hypothetical protein